jgi:hypothetical protein
MTDFQATRQNAHEAFCMVIQKKFVDTRDVFRRRVRKIQAEIVHRCAGFEGNLTVRKLTVSKGRAWGEVSLETDSKSKSAPAGTQTYEPIKPVHHSDCLAHQPVTNEHLHAH